jgi:hypothetical protein
MVEHALFLELRMLCMYVFRYADVGYEKVDTFKTMLSRQSLQRSQEPRCLGAVL